LEEHLSLTALRLSIKLSPFRVLRLATFGGRDNPKKFELIVRAALTIFLGGELAPLIASGEARFGQFARVDGPYVATAQQFRRYTTSA
jgi:hypothetical protein